MHQQALPHDSPPPPPLQLTDLPAPLTPLADSFARGLVSFRRDAERVEKMAEYVARNGGNFEDMVREREKDNKMLSFLFSGELHQ